MVLLERGGGVPVPLEPSRLSKTRRLHLLYSTLGKCQALDRKFFQTYTVTVSASDQQQAKEKRGRGRPRQYPEGADGAPQVTVRFAPDLVTWVKDRGGATYIRALVVEDRERATGQERRCSHCKKVILPGSDRVDVLISREGTSSFHLECALPLLKKR